MKGGSESTGGTLNRERFGMRDTTRHLGLLASTSIGVGAIVGGGILALAGTALAASGPGALLAFALNGAIAVLTALSFAELSTAFPHSGGTYVFAKRVLSVGAAFSVGWVVWFASIMAASLYALGFSSFALQSVLSLWPDAPAWLGSPAAVPVMAIVAVLLGTLFLSRTPGSGGTWINVVKVLVFGVLVVGGAIVWLHRNPPVAARLSPFLPRGAGGLFQAMGYTFIAFQGFDLIAAVAGEVKEPRRVLPRAMLLSLGAALVVYLPLMWVILMVGASGGTTVVELARANPDTIVAVAARNYLGGFGFWLVMASGILAMLSALLANLFAAARIAQSMARDRTLPSRLEGVHKRLGTPLQALVVTATIVCLLLAVVGDVSSAGAASSLIFLVSFALAHLICILARKRRPDHGGFLLPAWPLFPAVGGIACAALAVFQGIAVHKAGLIAGAWLGVGFFFYLWVFGPRARVSDAASELADPDLLELRGRSPLSLVPIANPASAGVLATLAACLSPRAGRVLLLNIVRPPNNGSAEQEVQVMADVLRRSMAVSIQSGIRVECLATISRDPWEEIERVARIHRCVLTLFGMTDLSNEWTRGRLERLISRLPGNVAILRSPDGWDPGAVRKILVPIGGRVVHNALRARLLTALLQQAREPIEIAYMIVVPESMIESERSRLRRVWSALVIDECGFPADVAVVIGEDVAAAVLDRSKDSDLILIGLSHVGGKHRLFGTLVSRIVGSAPGAALVIGQRE